MEEEVAQPDWTPGRVVGPYRLLAKLATGGMAEIWAACQSGMKGFEKLVVVKKILESFAREPHFVEMFLDEARIAAQLTHPNIVQIYDLGEIDSAYYIAMEYVAGESLSSVVRTARKAGEKLPTELAARIISDAAGALEYAHTKKALDGRPLSIVHRDVSPQNLLVTYDGIVKLVDFGVAKAANRSSQTQSGQLKGKLRYMSPEQIRAKVLDGRSDVFALGILLFEALSGTKLVPRDASEIAIMDAIAGKEPLPKLSARWPEAPAELDRIVSRAMERKLDARYQSARELQVDLEGWLRSRQDLAGMAELAAFMRRLFAERIAARTQLLEQMMTEDVSSSRIRGTLNPDTNAGTPSGARAMPAAPGLNTRTVAQESTPPPKRSPLPLVAGGLVLLLGAAGGAALLLTRQRPAPEVTPVIEAPLPQLGTLAVETEPKGAMVVVDGKQLGPSPQTLEKVALGEHTVAAMLDGYVAVSRATALTTAGERSNVVLVLNRIPPEPEPADAGKALKPVVQKGKLSIDTTPWTTVFLEGRKLGDTPIIGLTLPAGTHKVKLVSEDAKQTRTIEVEIQPGKTTVKNLRL